MVALARDAVADFRVVQPDRPVTADLNGAALVLGDRGRLHQVVDNLLANARTHTPPGTPVHVSTSQQNGHLDLTVSDDGPGISVEDQPRIFERFWRGDPSRVRRTGGTGLGLAIVASLVQAHGGTITLTSEPGTARRSRCGCRWHLPLGTEEAPPPVAIERGRTCVCHTYPPGSKSQNPQNPIAHCEEELEGRGSFGVASGRTVSYTLSTSDSSGNISLRRTARRWLTLPPAKTSCASSSISCRWRSSPRIPSSSTRPRASACAPRTAASTSTGWPGVFTVSLGHGNRRIIDAMTAQLNKIAFAPPLHGTNPLAHRAGEGADRVRAAGLRGRQVRLGRLRGDRGGHEDRPPVPRQPRQRPQVQDHRQVRRRTTAPRWARSRRAAAGSGSRSSSRCSANFLHVHPPYCYRCPYGQMSDGELRQSSAPTSWSKTIVAEDPATVAAIIMEPISISSAGFVVPPREPSSSCCASTATATTSC